MTFQDWLQTTWRSYDHDHGGRSLESRFHDLLKEAYVGGLRESLRAIDSALMQLRSIPDSKAKQSARRTLCAQGLKLCRENGIGRAETPTSLYEFSVPVEREDLGEEGA